MPLFSMNPGSDCLGVDDWTALYAAVQFADAHGLWLDTRVAIVWSLVGAGAPADAERLFQRYLASLRDWLSQRKVPLGWVYVHEQGPVQGDHTHLAIYIPDVCVQTGGGPTPLRRAFRAWNQKWAQSVAGGACPRAVRVTGPTRASRWQHWLAFSYLCKGYDRQAVVVSGRHAPDGREIGLGDLIAFQWKDPGRPGLQPRWGVSRSLDKGSRARGVPAGLEVHYPSEVVAYDPFRRSVVSAATPFRSSFEDGVRDVRGLYPLEFLSRIRGWSPSASPPGQPHIRFPIQSR